MNDCWRLNEEFGGIDIYLFDQLLRGRIGPGMRVLDAGCGGGRNLVYLLRRAAVGELEVFGSDAEPGAIASVRRLAAAVAPNCPPDNFRVEMVERMSYEDEFADVVISSAVLHFAKAEDQFLAMVSEIWRVLTPGGLLFCRLASSIGLENRVVAVGGNRYRLPDGSERYLVNAATLDGLTARLGGTLADPLKTTLVQDQRSMTTWVVRKNAARSGAAT